MTTKTQIEKRKKRDQKFEEFSKKFEVERTFEELDEIDKTLIHLQLETPSISTTELAKQVKLSFSTVHNRIHKTDYKNILSELLEEPIRVLMEGRVKAAKRLVDIIEHGKDADANVASKTLLFGTGTLIDKRYANLNIHNDNRSIEFIIPSDYMPKFTPEQLAEIENNDKPSMELAPEIFQNAGEDEEAENEDEGT